MALSYSGGGNPDVVQLRAKVTRLEEENGRLGDELQALSKQHEELRVKHNMVNARLLETRKGLFEVQARLGL